MGEAFVNYILASYCPYRAASPPPLQSMWVYIVGTRDSIVELPGAARIGAGAIVISSLLSTRLSVRLIWSGLTGKRKLG